MAWETERRALEVFDEAIDLSRIERDRLLDSACTDNPKLRDLVEAMLDEDATPDIEWKLNLRDVISRNDHD